MQLMNDTFRDMLDKSVLVFLDDILVSSEQPALAPSQAPGSSG